MDPKLFTYPSKRGVEESPEGGWPGVPLKCSIQFQDGPDKYVSKNEDQSPHFNSNSESTEDRLKSGEFRAICKDDDDPTICKDYPDPEGVPPQYDEDHPGASPDGCSCDKKDHEKLQEEYGWVPKVHSSNNLCGTILRQWEWFFPSICSPPHYVVEDARSMESDTDESFIMGRRQDVGSISTSWHLLHIRNKFLIEISNFPAGW